MISLTDEIELALSKNSAKIEKLIDAYNKGSNTALTDEELDKTITQLGAKIAKLKANNYTTIAQKLSELDKEYKATVGFMKDDPTNPINRYCEIHTITDNFATTALTDKVIYALDIESQLDRALSYLVLLDGEDNEKVNIDLMKTAHFPDPEEGATNKYGDPFCYLLNGYAHLQNKNNYIEYSIYDGQALYGFWGGYADTSLIYKGAKRIILSDEDIAEFGRRLNGRTILEEMLLAGFKESDMRFEVPNKDKFYGVYPHGFPDPKGIAFKFENIQCDKNKVELYKGEYLFGRYLDTLAPASKMWLCDERAICPGKGEQDDYYAIITKGIKWNETTIQNYTSVIHWNKSKHHKMGPGSLFRDPQIYFYKR